MYLEDVVIGSVMTVGGAAMAIGVAAGAYVAIPNGLESMGDMIEQGRYAHALMAGSFGTLMGLAFGALGVMGVYGAVEGPRTIKRGLKYY